MSGPRPILDPSKRLATVYDTLSSWRSPPIPHSPRRFLVTRPTQPPIVLRLVFIFHTHFVAVYYVLFRCSSPFLSALGSLAGPVFFRSPLRLTSYSTLFSLPRIVHFFSPEPSILSRLLHTLQRVNTLHYHLRGSGGSESPAKGLLWLCRIFRLFLLYSFSPVLFSDRTFRRVSKRT